MSRETVRATVDSVRGDVSTCMCKNVSFFRGQIATEIPFCGSFSRSVLYKRFRDEIIHADLNIFFRFSATGNSEMNVILTNFVLLPKLIDIQFESVVLTLQTDIISDCIPFMLWRFGAMTSPT